MRALVTGGRGFVGRWLASHLEKEGDEVVATGEEVDVTDADAVRRSFDEIRPEAVYHLAGWAAVGSSWSDPSGAFSVNANGAVHVLDAARRLDAPPRVLDRQLGRGLRRVQAGAAAALRGPCRCRRSRRTRSSKVAAEVAARQFAAGFDLGVVIARPFNHIGPGQSPGFVVSDLAKRIVEAERSGATVLEMGNPSPRRDLTDVRDVVRAYRLLVERGTAGETYNVCTGTDVVIGELAQRMIELSGVPLELRTGSVEHAPDRRARAPRRCHQGPRRRRLGARDPAGRDVRDVLAHWRDAPPED